MNVYDNVTGIICKICEGYKLLPKGLAKGVVYLICTCEDCKDYKKTLLERESYLDDKNKRIK